MQRTIALITFGLVLSTSNFSIGKDRPRFRDFHFFDNDDIQWTLLAEGVWEGDDGSGSRNCLHMEGEAGLLWEIELLEGWLRRIDEAGDPSDERFKDLYKEKLEFLYYAYFVYHGGASLAKTDCSTCEPLTGAWCSVKVFWDIGVFWADADINGPFGNCPSSCQVVAAVNGNI